MLSPEARSVAMDLLKPPAGWRLDQAVLTSFSLDLETLLALPLAVMAQADGGLEELLEQPLLLLTALREAGERVHVFVDRAGIGIPRVPRALYAMLEQSVHPVSAPNGGAFHPKVWIARFVADDEPPRLRIAVLSRNLTDDRSWDLALASEATPNPRRKVAATRPLADLLRALPGLSDIPLPAPIAPILDELANELGRTAFPAPAGFAHDIRFHGLGLGRPRSKPWQPPQAGKRLLAMAPFANKTGLDAVAGATSGERTLICRAEALDDLPESVLVNWQRVLVLCDAAGDEFDDAQSGHPSGLHAKAVCIEHGWDATWLVGSANLTSAAFLGRNVEVMAELTGRRGTTTGPSGCGIERFLNSIEHLCEPYRRTALTDPDVAAQTASARLDAAQQALLKADLKLCCRADDEEWLLTLAGDLLLPKGIDAACWPVSIREDQAMTTRLPLQWRLPGSRLTSFVAFRLHAPELPDADRRLTLKLPAEGLPDGRLQQVLRTLIDNPERLLQFLRALLGGLEGLVDWAQTDDIAGAPTSWSTATSDAALLEDLVRAASREPSRLAPIRQLIEDLRQTEEGRKLVPEDLLLLWQAVDGAISQRGTA